MKACRIENTGARRQPVHRGSRAVPPWHGRAMPRGGAPDAPGARSTSVRAAEVTTRPLSFTTCAGGRSTRWNSRPSGYLRLAPPGTVRHGTECSTAGNECRRAALRWLTTASSPTCRRAVQMSPRQSIGAPGRTRTRRVRRRQRPARIREGMILAASSPWFRTCALVNRPYWSAASVSIASSIAVRVMRAMFTRIHR